MKKASIILVFASLGIGMILFQVARTDYKIPFEPEEAKPFDKPGEAQSFFVQKRLGEGMKELPMERLAEGKRHMQGMNVFSSALNEFVPSGETRALGDLGSWESLGPGNIGGRTRAIVIDPNNPNVIYTGAVSGGVWKSTDGGTNFAPLDDMMANLAVVCLAMDPTDSDVIYAGTGEGFWNLDAVRGDGIFKTVDGGTTWTQLAFTAANSDFYYVSDLVISPNNHSTLYAGTSNGVFLSTDGGASWSHVHNPGTTGGCTDLVIRTDATGTSGNDIVLAAVGNFVQATVYKNADAAGVGTWDSVFTETMMGRTSLAIAPSDQSVMYALSASVDDTIDYENGLHAVFQSQDGGDTWTAQVRNDDTNVGNTLLLTNAPGYFAWGSFSNQGWYDNVIAVDPSDSNTVWVGGIDLFRSTNGGQDWEIASLWWLSTAYNEYVHADQHAIVFHPDYDGTTNKILFVGNDGGIFKTSNALDNTAPVNATNTTSPGHIAMTWESLNHSYAVTQFYHGTPYPDGATYFGGCQDNGTIRGSDSSGLNSWNEIVGGDGGYTAIDPGNTDVLYAEYTGISIQKSTDGGSSFSDAVTGINDNGGLFINPFWMDPTDSNRLYTGGWYLWRTNNSATNWTKASAITAGNGSVSAVATAPSNADYALAGMSDGYIHRTDTATSANGTTAWPNNRPLNGYISSVAFDPLDESICYATSSTFGVSHVWRSTDSGANWSSIDGTPPNDIPDIPVHSIVVHPQDSSRLYVGTDLGIFVSSDTGTTWSVENTGFSNVVTEHLSMLDDGCYPYIFAFTHGRGTWRVGLSTLELPVASADLGSGASSGNTFGVTTWSTCSWSATSNDSWIHITGGSPGTGDGTVTYSVDFNGTCNPRTGTISIDNKTFTVNQDFGIGEIQPDYVDVLPDWGSTETVITLMRFFTCP